MLYARPAPPRSPRSAHEAGSGAASPSRGAPDGAAADAASPKQAAARIAATDRSRCVSLAAAHPRIRVPEHPRIRAGDGVASVILYHHVRSALAQPSRGVAFWRVARLPLLLLLLLLLLCCYSTTTNNLNAPAACRVGGVRPPLADVY